MSPGFFRVGHDGSLEVQVFYPARWRWRMSEAERHRREVGWVWRKRGS